MLEGVDAVDFDHVCISSKFQEDPHKALGYRSPREFIATYERT
jgi:hypothetical protein